MKELINIQSELKAPKSQLNKFGGYKYRSCEDILEAVKPLLKKEGLAINLTDSIKIFGDRFYVESAAKLLDKDKNLVAISVGYAREPASKKGMDESQVTGAAASYARKYALNGLFAIDDSKDADHRDNTDEGDPIIKKLSGLKTLEAVGKYWNDLTEDQQEQYRPHFTAKRKSL